LGPFGGLLDATSSFARLSERPDLGKLSLRLHPEARASAERTFGLQLPAAQCATVAGALTVLSVSPTEMLVVMPLGELGGCMAKLQDALAEQDAAVVDVSSSTTVLRLSGSGAVELLYRGCSIELQAPMFAVGHCAATKIGKIAILVHHVADEASYDLYVPRSLAFSLLSWLTSHGIWRGLPDGVTAEG
jgi:sarcosine oxidase, subunit gamma